MAYWILPKRWHPGKTFWPSRNGPRRTDYTHMARMTDEEIGYVAEELEQVYTGLTCSKMTGGRLFSLLGTDTITPIWTNPTGFDGARCHSPEWHLP